MSFKFIVKDGIKIGIAQGKDILISNGQDALDLIAGLRYGHGCDRLIIPKELVSEEFFDLRSGIAGEVLQKYVNYHVKIAITGDFSHYTSKALRDFIYECNNGSNIFFSPSEEEAVKALAIKD